MIVLLTIIHIVAAVVMILAVLLQSGKSADLAGAFGGGGSQTAFGPRGAATALSKITTGTAIVFMLTSFALSILASRRTGSSVLQGASSAPVRQTVPVSAPPATPQPNPATPAAQSGSSNAAAAATVTVEKKGTASGASQAKQPTAKQKSGSSSPEKKQ